ncbi:MAG TPA: outer membrane protein assembly factor BamD [Bryobacteraceae bacterium]|nr:outer membrane protein assembly factor BamD [Bryobacteraceae bacterium]
MRLHRKWFYSAVIVAASLLAGCAGKKYDNPITKDTQQPDKVLFDKAIKDIEKGRYEIARLTLQTLINTYDQSEFLAKAKLAVADSWYRESGSHGLAQAEAEYKDFILFYPTMEEAAEAQEKVCNIHYRQMEKADRDPTHAVRAEEECRQVLVQFPNSRFAPKAQQTLREIQEVLALGEYRVGTFYHTKGVYYASANRLNGLTQHYPLFSQADDALWKLGDSYSRMGPRFRDRASEAYAKLIRDYPLSSLVPDAKQRLTQMEQPIPEPDPVALARMKYELENRKEPGMMSHFWGIFRKSPDVSLAAKSGTPVMESLRPTTPVTVQASQQAAAAAAAQADVTGETITGPSALDTLPDARRNQGQQATQGADTQQPQPPAEQPKKNTKNN